MSTHIAAGRKQSLGFFYVQNNIRLQETTTMQLF